MIKTRSTYDHAGRVTATYQQIDKGTEERLALMTYNELGELKNKLLARQGLQQVDYAYNIRGWLKRINKADLSAELEDNKGQFADQFGIELSYHQGTTLANTPVSAQFNGNISYQKWKTASDQVARGYSYQYDHLNRLTSATYQVVAPTGASNVTLGDFSIDNIRYDVSVRARASLQGLVRELAFLDANE